MPIVVTGLTPTPLNDSFPRRNFAQLNHISDSEFDAQDLTAVVAEIFGDVIGRPPVPVHVPFPMLGGTSMDAAVVSFRLAQFLGHPVPTSSVFRHQTAAALATELGVRGKNDARIDESQEFSKIPLTAVQGAFLFKNFTQPDEVSSHCAIAFEISHKLDFSALDRAVSDVHEFHEGLGSRYFIDDGPFAEPRHAIAPETVVLPSSKNPKAAEVALRTELARPLAPQEGLVWRVVVAPVSKTRSYLLGVVVHHITYDGWSLGILTRDLSDAYNAHLRGLAPSWRQILNMSELHRLRVRYLGHVDLVAQRRFWRGVLDGVPALVFQRPTDLSNLDGGPGRIEIAISPRELQAIDHLASQAETTRFTALLGLYTSAITAASGQHDIGIGFPATQRFDPQMSDVLGCYINTLCFRTGGLPTGSVLSLVRAAASRINSALANQDISWPEVVREINPPRDGRSPLYQNVFVLQDTPVPCFAPGGTAGRVLRQPPFDLTAEVVTEVWPEERGGALLTVGFRKQAVSASFASQLAQLIGEQIRQLPTIVEPNTHLENPQ